MERSKFTPKQKSSNRTWAECSHFFDLAEFARVQKDFRVFRFLKSFQFFQNCAMRVAYLGCACGIVLVLPLAGMHQQFAYV
jgi:hypothetical protein